MSLKLCLFTVVNFLMSITTCFATSNQVRYTAAVVIFNYTDASTSLEQEPTYLGSQSAIDEVGAYAYGSSFPAKCAFGVVVHSLDDSTGLKDGCDYIYSKAPRSQPWIALISRGVCKFSKKIENAYKQNASGVIIYDNELQNDAIVMHVEDAPDIAAVSITRKLGCQVAKLIDEGTQVFVNISPGQGHMETSGFDLQTTSIIFVCVSFVILIAASLAWLVVYYMHRVRVLRRSQLCCQRHYGTPEKALEKIPTHAVQYGDGLMTSEALCAICIEGYNVGESLRDLPCKHSFHKGCVDKWLQTKQTCPMCKQNVVKALGMEQHVNTIVCADAPDMESSVDASDTSAGAEDTLTTGPSSSTLEAEGMQQGPTAPQVFTV